MKKLPKPVLILTRLIFTPVGLICGILIWQLLIDNTMIQNLGKILIGAGYIISAIIGGIVLYFLVPLICQLIYDYGSKIVATFRHYTSQEIISSSLGLIAGVFFASLLCKLFDKIEPLWLTVTLSVLCYIFFAFLGIIIGEKYLKGVIVPTDACENNVPKILDASAIIDGRILDVSKTGFIEGPFIIPCFIISQLQSIADNEDLLKRSRGRRGLDIIRELQENQGINVIVDDSTFPELPDIDSQLIRLAIKLKGIIITVDYNLNKAATANKIKVLNFNELSNAIKPVAIPGEKLSLTILKEGKEQGQGVSYLEDGTMVVVENGGPYIGKNAVITITTSLQTNAGRIIFGRIFD